MKTILAITLLAFAASLTGCSSPTQKAERGELPVGNASSPTEAYKMLFSAVKSKDSQKIKSMLSEASIKMAEFSSQQYKKTFEESIANGFLATTMSETMPEIRNEQVKGAFATIEVYNAKAKMWESTAFINENGGWKLAVGDQISGRWEPPGKSMMQRELESSNTNPPQTMQGANVDWNKVKPIKIDPKAGNMMKGPNPTLGNVKPQKIPTH